MSAPNAVLDFLVGQTGAWAGMTGVCLDYAGTTAPNGWLMCYGQAVSRTTYAALFAAIGTAHGAGDGSTTFNVPDARGRAIIGKDDMGGAAAGRVTAGGSGVSGTTLGAAGGAETHTLTTAQMPTHTHANTLNESPHSHTIGALSAAAGSGTASGGGYSGTISISGSATTGITISNASQGGGGAHPNVQPSMVLNKIIKT